jgi:hypothetical protein
MYEHLLTVVAEDKQAMAPQRAENGAALFVGAAAQCLG